MLYPVEAWCVLLKCVILITNVGPQPFRLGIYFIKVLYFVVAIENALIL
ncbi:hypothetical protein ACUW9N_000395 [Staphylococcus auricularis]|nr:Uncharacterised protein [Staphylococcus auricularis]